MPRTPRIRKGHRLSTIIGLSLVAPLLVFSAVMLTWSFNTTRQALDKEIDYALLQKQSLAEHILDSVLTELEHDIANLAQDDVIRILSNSGPSSYLYDQIVSLSARMTPPPDILFFGPARNGEWLDCSSPFFHTSQLLEFIQPLQSELRMQSRILHLSTPESDMTLMLTAEAVIQQDSGQVLGVLVGGIVLNDNVQLLDTIRRELQVRACVLYSGGVPIASTASSTDPFFQAVTRIQEQDPYSLLAHATGRSVRLAQGLIAHSHPVNLGRLDTPLTLVLGAEDNTYEDVQNNFLSQLWTVLLFFLLFIAFIILTVRLMTFSPLKRILNYAMQVSSDVPDASFEPGGIKEFNQLGQAINSMVVKLNTSRGYVRNIIDAMPSILVGVDEHGNITHFNRMAEQHTRIMEEPACGRQITDIVPELSGQMELVTSAIQNGQAVCTHREYPTDQGARHMDVTVYPLTLEGMKGAVVRIDDVTERVRIEEMVIQSEKILSVGSLAAGMAHEINNPLAAILGNAQILGNRLRPGLKKNHAQAQACGLSFEDLQCYLEGRGVPELIDAIQSAGKRAAAIVSNMLNFSRQSDYDSKPTDIRTLLDNTLILAATDYDLKRKYDFKQMKLVRNYPSSLALALCDPGRVQQVLLNILKNGAEAMSEKHYAEDAPCFILTLENDAPYVKIVIEDNGPGMTREIQRRIFEPFFTTKEVGQGTGLGLAISYFIITETEKGKLEVASSPEQWTRFSIFLPMAQESSTA